MQEQSSGLAEMDILAPNLRETLTTFGLGKMTGRIWPRCTRSNEKWRCDNTSAPGSRWCEKHRSKGRWVTKDWSKRDYKSREVNENAEAEFALKFPNTKSPWGQSEELDTLIKHGQSDSPGLDRTFLGVRVERCTNGVSIQMLAGEDTAKDTVVLVARTLHPRAGDWVWDDRAEVEHVDGGWLVTLKHVVGGFYVKN